MKSALILFTEFFNLQKSQCSVLLPLDSGVASRFSLFFLASGVAWVREHSRLIEWEYSVDKSVLWNSPTQVTLIVLGAGFLLWI